MTSLVTVMTGRLATTSFEAGGALGGCSMIPWHQNVTRDQYFHVLLQFQLPEADLHGRVRKLYLTTNCIARSFPLHARSQ